MTWGNTNCIQMRYPGNGVHITYYTPDYTQEYIDTMMRLIWMYSDNGTGYILGRISNLNGPALYVYRGRVTGG